MKLIEKRIEKLELTTPTKPERNGLGEHYQWEQSDAGMAELNKLYSPDRNEINPKN